MKRIPIDNNGKAIYDNGKWYCSDRDTFYIWDESAPIGKVIPGMQIYVGSEQYVVVGHGRDTTALLYSGEHPLPNRNDSTNCDQQNSVAEEALLWAWEGGTFIPDDMLIEHKVKLMAANGDRPKINVKCNISLLTMDLYKRYRPYLADKNLGEFWLATPTSYTHQSNELCFVREDGRIGWCPFHMITGYMIRPFVIVDSAYTGYSLPELPE